MNLFVIFFNLKIMVKTQTEVPELSRLHTSAESALQSPLSSVSTAFFFSVVSQNGG